MDLALRNSCFVVTGGTSGLGLAGARALVDEGASVVIVGRDAGRAEGAAEDLGPRAHPVVADLADQSAVEQMLSAAAATGLPLGGALISVGGPPAGTALEISEEQWRQSFETIVLGPLRLLSALVALTGEQRTEQMSVAMVLSSSAKVPIPGLAISNALRPGLAVLVKDLADQFGPAGIRVNGLMPGRVDTDRVRHLDARAPDPAAARSHQESLIPLRRYGRPEEFGSVAAFLLSPAASYVNGSMIPVDGGALRAL